MSDNKKVLITGGFGFIGSNLALYLQEQGYHVEVVDNFDPNSGANIYNIPNEQIHKFTGDILDDYLLGSLIPGQDFIINCAASTSHSLSMKTPFANLDVNVFGVLKLLEAIRLHNPEVRLIQLGTTSQYGQHGGGMVLDETDAENPLDIYSANKSVAEKFCKIYGQFHGLNTTCLRLSNVFGERAAIHTPQLSFHNYFIGLAVQGKPLTIYGSGKQLRNFIWVKDVIRAIMICMLSEETTRNQVYNIVHNESISVVDFAIELARLCNVEINQIDWPEDRKNTEIGDCLYSNEKFKNVIPWDTCNVFHSLEQTINFYKKYLKEYIK